MVTKGTQTAVAGASTMLSKGPLTATVMCKYHPVNATPAPSQVSK